MITSTEVYIRTTLCGLGLGLGFRVRVCGREMNISEFISSHSQSLLVADTYVVYKGFRVFNFLIKR